jgi:hypothetical protein
MKNISREATLSRAGWPWHPWASTGKRGYGAAAAWSSRCHGRAHLGAAPQALDDATVVSFTIRAFLQYGKEREEK